MPKTIIVGMSGGVDSSVTAGLLLRQGWDVRGVFFILQGESRQASNAEDARRSAEQLGIQFHSLNISSHFKKSVLDPFVEEYLLGRTPNPCILCNPMVKFHTLVYEAKKIGADKIATGHYVRTGFDEHQGRWFIRRAKDNARDQSYFLSRLSQEQISSFIAPMGEYTKDQVCQIAAEMGFPHLLNKPSSQEICFIAGNYRDFLKSRPEVRDHLKPGDIVDKNGNVLGRHKGLAFYTIGQREGLGIAHPHPLYVISIVPEKNRIVVGSKEDTFSSRLHAEDMNWVAIDGLKEEIRCGIQIRYRKRAEPGIVTPGKEPDSVDVLFDEPQMAIAPGQAAVLYDGDRVLGGGTIM